MRIAGVVSSLVGHGLACSTDIDCSLNGLCKGSCVCDKPWSGASCETMNFRPVTFPQGYGMAPNLTAWGGGAIYDGKNYHSYIHTLTHGCPLACGSNSRIEHAVSDRITGPYSFRDVAVPTDARNSAPVTLPDGTFAIFHIKDGAGHPDGGVNCTVGRGQSSPRFPCPSHPNATFAVPDGASGSTIHTSSSLGGPWQPVAPNTLGGCGNPAPHVHKNGSLFIVCNHNKLLRAESVHGPWTTVHDLSSVIDGAGGGVLGRYEDPFMYQDVRSNWHVIYHVYNVSDGASGGPGACLNATVSGHIFSQDGHSWHPAAAQPYSSQVVLSDGRHITVSTRERPNIFFDAAGQMTHLFNAVCSASGDSCAAHTGTGCVDCKYEKWDYNLVAPLAV